MTETRQLHSDALNKRGPSRPQPPKGNEPPIKTPNPPDADKSSPAAEVPKVGSQDAPGG